MNAKEKTTVMIATRPFQHAKITQADTHACARKGFQALRTIALVLFFDTLQHSQMLMLTLFLDPTYSIPEKKSTNALTKAQEMTVINTLIASILWRALNVLVSQGFRGMGSNAKVC